MSMKGIDISNWQAGIDLNAVDYDFVMMKATQGTQYVSPDFARQYQQAKNAGKHIGIYHYASGDGAIAEADFFLKTIQDCIGEAILVLDWETGGNAAWSQGPAYAKQFLDRVYKKTAVRALMYMSKSVCDQYDWSEIAPNHGLWVAQYGDNTTTEYEKEPWTDENGYGAWRGPIIFQYSSAGSLEGYEGNIDLNIAYMDAVAWNKYAGKSPPTGSTLELVVEVMQGKYGDGDARKKALGTRYKEVMDVVNHIATSKAKVLATETAQGKYGNGEVRKIVLGTRYEEVQKLVNASID